jgi:hypothetical protein
MSHALRRLSSDDNRPTTDPHHSNGSGAAPAPPKCTTRLELTAVDVFPEMARDLRSTLGFSSRPDSPGWRCCRSRRADGTTSSASGPPSGHSRLIPDAGLGQIMRGQDLVGKILDGAGGPFGLFTRSLNMIHKTAWYGFHTSALALATGAFL